MSLISPPVPTTWTSQTLLPVGCTFFAILFQIVTLCILLDGFKTSSNELENLYEKMARPLKVGPISSVKPNTDGRPRIIMAMDIDYPPYAYIRKPPFNGTYELDEVVGVGADMIKALGKHCNFDVTITQGKWDHCWETFHIGEGLREGWYHGCMTFTHAAGVRNRFLDFTGSWAIKNKPAGLITRLDRNGVPHINGQDDLAGRTIVDVTGWAPTADTLYFVNNECTGKKYSDLFKMKQSVDIVLNHSFPTKYYNNKAGDYPKPKGHNDHALLAVLEGHADAMWVYGDQAEHYQCDPDDTQDGWDCDLWSKFGTDFAYIQTGMFPWMHNGTTFAFSKKGSGLNELLNPCIDSFLTTEEFYETCKLKHRGHDQLQTCLPNAYIKNDSDYVKPEVQAADMNYVHDHPHMFATKELSAVGLSCSDGFCTCSE